MSKIVGTWDNNVTYVQTASPTVHLTVCFLIWDKKSTKKI